MFLYVVIFLSLFAFQIKLLHIVYCQLSYSHSIVAGGLLLISYTTRLIPFTLLMISLEILAKNSYGQMSPVRRHAIHTCHGS
jgi:hypothetical protein